MSCSGLSLQSKNKKIESSIIIPVFNQWELSRACLKALASTTKGKSVEVIVVDNASTDITQEACPFLGKQLFGDAFRYFRCTSNMNFGPSSNIGAAMAVGEYLIFLNNDTVPLPGWYQPLIDDFSRFLNIAATGPLLLYPKSEPFGHTVQHLGVFVSPFLKVGHLYEGIPADSPLTQKRRFFQIITGACMVIPRKLFIAVGLFDEEFINGFEDVDLCMRLWQQGYRMTVNPRAKVIHHKSQTPGRHQHEEANSRYLSQKCRNMFIPDWHEHLRNDGMSLRVGAWQTFQASLPPDQCRRLDTIAAVSSHDELKDLLVRHPFWENGWRCLIATCPTEAERALLQIAMYRLYPSADKTMEFYASAAARGDKRQASIWLNSAVTFCKSFEGYVSSAQDSRTWCGDIGLADMAVQYMAWLADAESFNTKQFQPFLTELWQVLVACRVALPPHAEWAYTAWRYNVDLPRRTGKNVEIAQSDGNGTAFSILMPVYNPKAEHLTAALDSVFAQDYPHWELCIADDASTDAAVTAILTRYAEKDDRIRVIRREENGHIAAATNTALKIAHNPWVVLLDQDDLLTPDALRLVAESMAKHPEGLLFYSDEDKIDDSGRIFFPHFKNSKWDWELLLCQNYICHLAIYRTERLRALGGMREGFRGSQDHDLLMRYTAGVDAATLIHIPYVLYHWRAHAKSTASDINTKGEAVDSARRAVQDLLDVVSPGAMACVPTSSQWGRVRYPLPDKLPLVSLICDMGKGLPLLKAQLAALHAKTAYNKCEILVLYSEACSSADVKSAQRVASGYRHVRLLALPADYSQAQRLEKARPYAQGRVLGFLSAGLAPLSAGWLEELVACLWRANMAACGGKVISQGGTMVHGGWLVDADGQLKEIFKGVSAQHASWFGQNRLARTVDALDGLCFFTCQKTLEQVGGFDASLPESSVQDYCLRLGKLGLRTVWWPYAEFMLSGEIAVRATYKTRLDRAFQARWTNRLTPYNNNLMIVDGGWTLHYDNTARPAQTVIPSAPSENRGEFSAEDYLALYPDVRASGMDPLTHYLHYGINEGRKPCRTHIDYSHLSPEKIAAFQATPKGNIVVCTSLVGNYDKLLPPAFLNDEWRYVCYTDDVIPSYGIWELRPIPYQHDDPTRRSRWAKLHLPELFPDADWVFWIDSNIVIAEDLSPLLAAREREFPIYSTPHPVRNCIYEEAAACIASKKDDYQTIINQISDYKAQSMPQNFGLYENYMFMINPKNEDSHALFSQWWSEYEKYSKRDQISLPYILFLNGFTSGELLPGNISGRRYSGIYFLTHEETGLVTVPESIL